MKRMLELTIARGVWRRDLDRTALFLRVTDVCGSYTVPYIQTADELSVSASFADHGAGTLTLHLLSEGRHLATALLSREEPEASFAGLMPGEYSLTITSMPKSDAAAEVENVTRIGVGSIVAALGDSITEGYYGRAFRQASLDLVAADFPASAVSRDGRNFPQYAPTTHQHMPGVNCFESWMTMLNDALAAAWHQPVLIANEGWGGLTSAAYLELMQTTAWRERRSVSLRQLGSPPRSTAEEHARTEFSHGEFPGRSGVIT